MLGNMSQAATLPPLSSLPLQVVHNLPHLLAGNGNNNSNNSSNNNNSNPNLNGNNVSCNNNSQPGNNLLRSSMQHQQLLNNLSNTNNNNNNNNGNGNGNTAAGNTSLVANGALPPPTQLLQHHLQHLAHVNVNAAAAVVAVAANNLSNNLQHANGAGGNNNNNTILNHNNLNIIINNHTSNNNNNNPATPNANLTTATPTVNTAAAVAQQQQAHENSLVNSLVGVINGSSNNNTTNNNNNNSSNNNNNNSSNNNNNNGDDNNRWTQFQVQQLWKQHANYLNGRKSPFLGFICKANGKSTSNSKEIICPDDKYKEEGDIWNVEAQTAFLGPNLWDKTLPYDADLKVTQYADLDEFLSENNIPDSLPGTHLGHAGGLGHRSDSLSHAAGLSLGLGHITTKRERSPSPSDCISPDTLNPPSPAESTFSFASSGRDFDPRTRAFSDEELKPQPMIKKSRKQFVPDELKDDKYWARRRKNNIAAKRSRDARRQKENQIAMRARYLEKENATLHQEVEQLKQENMDLRARLSKFQDV
nr:DNA cross-link repair 1 protein isoform X1 [Drosophila virilis]